MIQRIQTLYLLAATALMSIFFFSVLATFAPASTMTILDGIVSPDSTLPTTYLAIIATLATILPFVNIFFFKKRMRQIRLCVVQMVLSLGTLAVAGAYYYIGSSALGEATIRIVCLLPIVAILFDYLALKAIFKDEMLIKSLDRIR